MRRWRRSWTHWRWRRGCTHGSRPYHGFAQGIDLCPERSTGCSAVQRERCKSLLNALGCAKRVYTNRRTDENACSCHYEFHSGYLHVEVRCEALSKCQSVESL